MKNQNNKPINNKLLITLSLLLCFILFFGMLSCSEEKPQLQSNATEVRVDSVLNLMTLEEKVGQLVLYTGFWEFTGPVPDEGNSKLKLDNVRNGYVGAMLNVNSVSSIYEAQKIAVEESRLGIPLLFGYDVIHGYKTMFPIPLAQAASWDASVAKTAASYAAIEATASGINWTFAPMVDVTRDSRWGRMMESPGEDPYLASIFAKAWVEGFQGNDLASPQTMAACAKHFAAYGFVEAGREYNTVDISDNTLFNVALPPFKAAADAGVATFMNAFNEVGGVPATGSEYLQRDILKDGWNWNGFIVSDWGSIGEMVDHGYAEDLRHAAEIGINTGSDMDMESYAYEKHLVDLVSSGEVVEEKLDDAVRRILRVKFDLGLFDDPYRYCSEKREKENILTNENLKAARDAARKSIVLLKNEDGLLPLPKENIKVAVIGSLAASKDIPLGSWRAQAIDNSAVSLLEGVENALGKPNVTFSNGYRLTEGERSFVYELNMVKDDESGFRSAIKAAQSADVVIMAMGEDCWQSGEGRSQVAPVLKGSQLALMKEVLKVNSKLIVTLMNGRSLVIPELAKNAPAILEVWHLGSEAGNAIADVIFGDYNPTGKLPVSFPRHIGQIPIYYNHKNTGRPTTKAHDAGKVFWSHYTDSPNSSLFPFGYGLSYSDFEFSEVRLSANNMKSNQSITASISLRNRSEITGTETVQLYIRDHVASLTRPVMELKSFQSITLEPNEEKEVYFEINKELLSFYRSDLTFGSEPGKFSIMIGNSSKNFNTLDIELIE
ncbi:MAG: beta-glucosidase BglX [Cyclobacteriaceae bacterium]